MAKKENYLDKVPFIPERVKWEEDDGKVFVIQEHKGFFPFIANKIFNTPKKSRVELEAFGTFVWKSIDGKRTIFDIGKLVSQKFGKEAEPLYERLSKYFYTLKDLKFVDFKKGGEL